MALDSDAKSTRFKSGPGQCVTSMIKTHLLQLLLSTQLKIRTSVDRDHGG